ncbi:MAG TPA: DoxX family protein [Puia sp.]|nr:DoxX family protein [Puia sp.]
MQYSRSQNLALFVLRLIIALIFFVAAYYKLPFWEGETMGMSEGMVNLMKVLSIAEPLGALAVLAGFLTKWAAIGLSMILLGAIYVVKFTYGIGFVTPTGPGWNFPLTVLACCIILLGFGAGNWSVDARKKS